MSLQAKILLVVAVVHAAAFAVLALVFTRSAEAAFRQGVERNREQHLAQLIRLIETTIARTQPKDVKDLANWSGRVLVRTGVIVQREDRAGTRNGRPQRQRYNINASMRSAHFDELAAQHWIDRAIFEDRMVRVGRRSYAFPIRTPGASRSWGGAFISFEESETESDLAVLSIATLLVSTLVVVALIYLVVSFVVLRPVTALAAGAERVAKGDFDHPIPQGGGGDEIARLTRTFNLMMARVANFSQELSTEVERATMKARVAERQLQQAQRLASTGRLAAGIAHEINNPLGGLMNATQALAEGRLSEERASRYLELIGEGLERIERIVGRVLQFTPRRAGPECFSVAMALHQALAMLEHRIAAEGVHLVLEPLDEEVRILGMVHEIQQVFLNLIMNALDALEEGCPGDETPTIFVSIQRHGERVQVCVRDNGPGVEEECLSKIGDLFYTSKEVGRGTGLGLSLCTGIVENHAGRLSISSTPGCGFEVLLVFPVAQYEESTGPPEGG